MHAVLERVATCRSKADGMRDKVNAAADIMDSMHYRQRGVVVPTPYGHTNVLLFRENDNMVIVQLPFGKPRARMYIPLEVIMQMERAVASSTTVAMEEEERICKNFYSREKGSNDAEVRLMAEEKRTLREKLAFDVEMQAEEAQVAGTVLTAISGAQRFLGSRSGRKELYQRTAKALEREIKKREIDIRTWSGKGARPKPLTTVNRIIFRVKTRRELRKRFLQEQATLAEQDARAAIDMKHKIRAQEATFEFVINDYLEEQIRETAEESLRSGLAAKSRAEDETGIVFPNPPHMQYDVYNVLSVWWMGKKKQLKKELEVWGARSAQDELKWEEERQKRQALVRDVELKELKEKEKRRQDDVGQQLRSEEVFVRRFYALEMKANLAERREMNVAEKEMRMYIKELAILDAASKSKYRVFTSGGDDDLQPSSKEQRRLALKKGKAEQQRIKREIANMMEEDELGQRVRTEEKKREQLEALKREMALYADDGGGDEDEAEEVENGNSDVSSEMSDEDDGEDPAEKLERELAEAARIEEEEKDLTEEEKAGNAKRRQHAAHEQRKLARKRKRAERAKERKAAKRDAAERAAAEELERARMAAMVTHAKAELEWMELEEEAKLVEKDLRVSQENLRKVTLYCQRKGQEEMRAKAKARRRRGSCEERLRLQREAVDWLKTCVEQMERCSKMKLRVDRDTRYMDTKAIAGVYQRWETDRLHAALHHLYFRTLAHIICNRSELVATERRLMRVQEVLLLNANETVSKTESLGSLWRRHARKQLMSLRRSALGKRIFRKWQRRIIEQVFAGWCNFFQWHLGQKSAFELQHALNLNGKKIADLTPAATDHAVARLERQPRDRTLHEKFTERPVSCRHCGVRYAETGNHSDACRYHPGTFHLSCPRWCPGLSTKCMAHRCKRWSCCDNRTEGALGSNGCCTRFHVPVDVDPTFEATVKKQDAEFYQKNSVLDEQLEKIKEADWVLTASKVKKDQIKNIADQLTAERVIVKRFAKYEKYINPDEVAAQMEKDKAAAEEKTKAEEELRLKLEAARS